MAGRKGFGGERISCDDEIRGVGEVRDGFQWRWSLGYIIYGEIKTKGSNLEL